MPKHLSYIVDRLRRNVPKCNHPGHARSERKSVAARRYRTDSSTIQHESRQTLPPLALAGGSVWKWDTERLIFKADQIGSRLIGVDKGVSIAHCLDPDHWESLYADLERCRIDGSPIRREVRCSRPDGKCLWLDIRGGRLPSYGEKRDAISGVLWDITENKLAQLSLQSENNNKDRFIAKLSHEMRTPLSAILGYCDLAIKRAPDEDLHHDLTVIRKNGVFLSRLIEDLLDLSRIVADKIQLEKRSVDIQALVQDLVAATTLRAIEKSIDFTVAPVPELPKHIDTDPVRLRQILQNLIDNAIKFTNEGEIGLTIAIERNASSETLVFEIRDTGSGIAQQDLERVFQPFEQVGEDVGSHGGIGLGLAVSQQLARLLGGHIDVESKCGRGSVFRLRLAIPDLNSAHASTRCSQALDPGDHANNSQVLIVEDHRALAHLTQQQLQRYGYDVRLAHSGKEVEQRIAGWTPTTVIIDLALPDTCGMALCRRMKSLPAFAACRFVAYSGRSERNDQRAAFAVGFDDYLLKPAKPAALQAAVQ